MFSHIGFFHFGTNHQEPLKALRLALDAVDKKALARSLLVLPEGFNISKLYSEMGQSNFDPGVLDHLRNISGEYGTTFVAGLIVSESLSPSPPYNSAYLIDQRSATLMCCKVREDHTPYGYTSLDQKNYTPHTDDADTSNPFVYRDEISIVALICLDFVDYTETGNIRREKLQKASEAFKPNRRVLCIPAHMAAGLFAFSGLKCGDKRQNVDWNSQYVILANSSRDGATSFVTDTDGNIVRSAAGEKNVIKLFPTSDS